MLHKVRQGPRRDPVDFCSNGGVLFCKGSLPTEAEAEIKPSVFP